MFRGRHAGVVATLALLAACGSGSSPTPSPPGPGGDSITGRERIGWDQTAGSAAELASLRFAIYVDGARSEIADVSCATAAGTAGFACSGRLPAMSAGTHILEIASFVNAGGIVESARSAPLRVTVAGVTTSSDLTALAPGEVIVTADGAHLTATPLIEGLADPTDVAVSADGRLFVTTADGRLSVLEDHGVREILHVPESEGRGGLLGVALAPDFASSGHLFVAASVAAENGNAFRVLRYRFHSTRLVDRMVVLPDVPASERPAATLRFGPDAKLYLALDSAGDDERAMRVSEWSGKILRFEADGRTPPDQPSASPVLWSGVRVPRGLDWSSDGTLWAAEDGTDGVERLRAIATSAETPRRPTPRNSYAMPQPFGGRAVGAYPEGGVPEFSGDLFLAGGNAGYLLRISFDANDRARAIRSERLLEGRLDTIRAVTVDRDGSLYICTGDTLWRLTASAPPQGRVSR